MSLIEKDLINSSKYSIKCPYEMQPVGIAIHNTYNDASAKNEVAYMKSNSNQVSFHIAIDNIEAIQAIPFNRNAWHAGDGGKGNGNRKYIAIEICYSKSGGDRFTKAENLASKVVAELLKQYGWGIDRIKTHRDFANKDCPHRTNMDQFKKMVELELNKSTTQDTFYRVVAGSYTQRANADAQIKALEKAGFKNCFMDIYKKENVHRFV